MTIASWTDSPALLAYTRTGFEADAAAEFNDRAAAAALPGYCRARTGTGLVEFRRHDGGPVTGLFEAIDFTTLVFPRQWLAGPGWLAELPPQDRLQPLLAALPTDTAYAEVWLEYPDTNEGKALSRFCRGFGNAVRDALRQAGRLEPHSPNRLHLLFTDSSTVFPGITPVTNSSAWHLGIPRLRLSRDAPSRSALKLEEALVTLLTPQEREARLPAGATAVDLGAAPGGWTWQLVRRGMHVIAVDNGPMDPSLLHGDFVEHQRCDGFRFQPAKTVDWLVCDMVEQPGRILPLVADWLTRRLCRQAVFNLKLPMKKRYKTVSDGLNRLNRALAAGGIPATVRCKQLYHDREEVTVAVLPARR